MAKAKRKLMRTAYKIKHHHIPKQGMSICSQFLGFFGQRLYFRNPENIIKNQGRFIQVNHIYTDTISNRIGADKSCGKTYIVLSITLKSSISICSCS